MTRRTRTRQFHNTFCLVRKTPFGMGIVEEWLHFAQDERILTDRSNRCGEPNYPGFKDHRHTQSIWSLLCKKHELTEAASTGTATGCRSEFGPVHTIVRWGRATPIFRSTSTKCKGRTGKSGGGDFTIVLSAKVAACVHEAAGLSALKPKAWVVEALYNAANQQTSKHGRNSRGGHSGRRKRPAESR